MKAIARKRKCPHCSRQNALSKKVEDKFGTWWRTCRYCATKVWEG